MGAVAADAALKAAGDIPCSFAGCPSTATALCPWCTGHFFVAYCDQVHRWVDWIEHSKHCAGVLAALGRGGACPWHRGATAARARASVTRPGSAHAETVPAPRAPVASVRKRHSANQNFHRGSTTLREAAAAAAAVVVTAPLVLLSPPARTRREYVLDPRSFESPDMTVQSVGRVLSVAVHSAAQIAGANAAAAVAMAMAVAGVSRAQVYRNLTTAETAQRAGVNPGEALKSRQGLHDKTQAAKKILREHWKTPLSQVSARRRACRRAFRISVVQALTRLRAHRSGWWRGFAGSS